MNILFINLHPIKYSEELHYYPFAFKLEKCAGSCNTLNDLSNEVCNPSKTEDLHIYVFDIITEKCESKILIKDIWFKFNCRFDWKKHNSDQWWNNSKCWYECKKNVMYAKKIIFRIPLNVVVNLENI